MRYGRKSFGTMFAEVAKALFQKPATEQYPSQRRPMLADYRGRLVYEPEKCVGCQLCVKDCPAEAIHLAVLDKSSKRFVIRYHVDRCIYCGQCVENCQFDCLAMSSTLWELASTDQNSFTLYFGRDEDVKLVLAKAAARIAMGPSED